MKIRGASSPIFAGGLMFLGAAMIVAGVFLVWFEVTWENESQIVRGIDDRAEATGILLFSGLIAAFAIVMLVRARKTGGRASSITALVFAVLVFIVGAFVALAPEQALPSFVSRELSETFNVSEGFAKAVVRDAIEAGKLNATSGVGAYLAFGGGALSAAGAIMAIVLAKRFRRVPEPTELPSSGIVTPTSDDLPPPPPGS